MKKLTTTLSLIALALMPARALAVNVISNDSIPNAVADGPTVSELIVNVVSILSFVAGVASVIAIIVGGIMYSVSGGNESRTKTAKDAILYAVIGLVISLSAFAIANFVITGLG
jgi:cytochrome c biogenesis protein CcdA